MGAPTVSLGPNIAAYPQEPEVQLAVLLLSDIQMVATWLAYSSTSTNGLGWFIGFYMSEKNGDAFFLLLLSVIDGIVVH